MAIQIPFPLPATGFALNSKLRINLDFIVSKFNEFNSGTATWDNVSVGTANSLTGTVTFYNSSNANYLTLQAGATDVSVTYGLPVIRPAGIASGTVYLSCDTTTNVMAWSGGGAFGPSTASYVTLALSSGLTSERVLTAGSGIGITDNGANSTVVLANTGVISVTGTSNQVTVSASAGNVTFSLPQSINTSNSPQFTALVLTQATNQLMLSGPTRTATVSAVQPATTNRVYTLPDAGADANICMTEGTYSINGAWGFSQNIVISGNKALVINDNAGTPKAVTIKTPAALTANYNFILPVNHGSANQVLTDDGAGNLSWAAATSGATTALDNLASVAVNLGLTPGVDNSIDLGTSSKAWKDIYLKGNVKSGSTNLLTLSTAGVTVLGTNTNDNAAAGYVGEYISASKTIATEVSAFGNGTLGDITSINLTAGDWDITGIVGQDLNGAVTTGFDGGIGSASGTGTTGLVYGDTRIEQLPATAVVNTYAIIPAVRVSLSGSATYYLKGVAFYSAGTPKFYGRISARRVR